MMSGDWNQKIEVNTGDEIEQFAGVFKAMMTDIDEKQKELQDFSRSLEAKVEDRTRELGVAQEATLNILEDLQASKENLERMNKELVKLDQMKSDFISTVSHELRTPLSIIKEGISLVLDEVPGKVSKKQEKILDISKSNVDRLARIIDDLLNISKIEAGRADLKKDLIDISKVARVAAKAFENKAKEKGLEMRLDVDDLTGKVWADADRIMQVLTNLIGNAVKFTSSGHIKVSCKEKDDQVVCSVSDTGPGISKDDIPKVFGKFQQFGRTAGPGDKGTGLGLSIAKSIIDMHNGAIWVESSPGKGSKFVFKLHKYTPQSLFKECVSRAISNAADRNSRMSVIIMNLSIIKKDALDVINKGFDDIMRDSVGLIRGSLRRSGDEVMNSGSDIIVVLVDCNREGVAGVQGRLEEMISEYMTGQNASGAIKVHYGHATYPDDAKDSLDLIEKARS